MRDELESLKMQIDAGESGGVGFREVAEEFKKVPQIDTG